jgi:hypothetical protein
MELWQVQTVVITVVVIVQCGIVSGSERDVLPGSERDVLSVSEWV